MPPPSDSAKRVNPNPRPNPNQVGDALQEPFWPEGLGINRGFLHCLDCADLAKGYAAALARHGEGSGEGSGEGGGLGGGAGAAALQQLCARREALFTVTKKISGHARTRSNPHHPSPHTAPQHPNTPTPHGPAPLTTHPPTSAPLQP